MSSSPLSSPAAAIDTSEGDAFLKSMLGQLAGTPPRAARAVVAPAPTPAPAPSAPAEASPPAVVPSAGASAPAPAHAETQGSPAVEMTAATPATEPASPAPRAKPGPKKRAAGQPKKRGPKPKAASEQRTHCVSVRLNVAELKALDARRGQLQRGEWMRLAEAGALPPAPASEINLQLHRQMASALSNLNQIAKALNTDRLSVEVEAALAEVRAFRNALIFPEALQRPGKKAAAAKGLEA